MKRPGSLKSRALQLLAQREQSKVELRRKLLRHARDAAAICAAAAGESGERGAAPGDNNDAARPDDAGMSRVDVDGPQQPAIEAQVDAVIAWLEANRFLSVERFAESRINARVARFGNLRIRHELAQHEVSLSAEAAEALATSELSRARAIRARKFPTLPDSAAEWARQTRFLGARGFSADVIRQALRDALRPDHADD